MAQGLDKKKGPEAVSLSKRLRMLADMVTPGNRVADVGCDHGFLSIYLVQAGICPAALAMDVRTGPLEAAKGHVAACGLGSYIEVRLSDGLSACGAGEADAVVCAGMGGRLMERILTEGMDRARQMRELILQPQSEIPQFRAFLREAGFAVVQEDAVFEEGKYYFAMKAAYGCGGSRSVSTGSRFAIPMGRGCLPKGILFCCSICCRGRLMSGSFRLPCWRPVPGRPGSAWRKCAGSWRRLERRWFSTRCRRGTAAFPGRAGYAPKAAKGMPGERWKNAIKGIEYGNSEERNQASEP